MKARGFSLVELLVAAALVLSVAAALAVLARGLQRAFGSSLADVDVTARGRAALLALTADVHSAGSGFAIGVPLQSLIDLTPVVRPHRSLGDSTVVAPLTAVALLRATGAQGVLRDRALSGTVLLQLDPAAPSARQDGTAGLQVGDSALIFDTRRVESATVAALDPASWTITIGAPLRQTYEAGSFVAAVERTSYGIRTGADGTTQLVRRTAAGAEQPVVDRVGGFEVSLWGLADPPMPAAVAAWFPTYGPLPPAIGVDDERDAWPPGENCSLTTDGAGQRLPRLAQSGPAGSLVRLTPAMLSDGPWCPDHTDPESFDADLLRVARIDLRLEVQPSQNTQGNAARVPLIMSVALRQR